MHARLVRATSTAHATPPRNQPTMEAACGLARATTRRCWVRPRWPQRGSSAPLYWSPARRTVRRAAKLAPLGTPPTPPRMSLVCRRRRSASSDGSKIRARREPCDQQCRPNARQRACSRRRRHQLALLPERPAGRPLRSQKLGHWPIECCSCRRAWRHAPRAPTVTSTPTRIRHRAPAPVRRRHPEWHRWHCHPPSGQWAGAHRRWTAAAIAPCCGWNLVCHHLRVGSSLGTLGRSCRRRHSLEAKHGTRPSRSRWQGRASAPSAGCAHCRHCRRADAVGRGRVHYRTPSRP